jgi:hypothetical protein
VCDFPDVAVLALAIVISLICSYISKFITLNTVIFIKWTYPFGGQNEAGPSKSDSCEI